MGTTKISDEAKKWWLGLRADERYNHLSKNRFKNAEDKLIDIMYNNRNL